MTEKTKSPLYYREKQKALETDGFQHYRDQVHERMRMKLTDVAYKAVLDAEIEETDEEVSFNIELKLHDDLPGAYYRVVFHKHEEKSND